MLAAEDRLKVTPTFSLVSGLRYEEIALDRTSVTTTGANRAGFPFSVNWRPTTGRFGFTWETLPGLTVYGQYATAADVSANNLFMLTGTQQPVLTRSRIYEAGIKQLFWERKAEWSLGVFDIARYNVYAAQGGQTLNLAGQQLPTRRGGRRRATNTAVESMGQFRLYACALCRLSLCRGSFSGNAPPNVPRIIANAGAAYRVNVPLPVEIGASVRHVGDRFNTDANTVTMLAYTVADAYAFIDLQKNPA